MAVDKDEIRLPDVPPSRPARRDATIEAAMRRFDGIDNPETSSGNGAFRPWMQTHRTQLGVAFSAFLLIIVGVPAALLGLRNGPVATPEHSAPATYDRAAPAPRQAPTIAQSEPQQISPVGVNGTAPLRKNRGDGLGVAEPAETAAQQPATAAEAPAFAPPPPAPPPPPPPAPPAAPASEVAKAERQADQASSSQELVVTGSAIRTPEVSAFQRRQGRDTGRSASGANTTNAKPKEASYSAFLSRLQAAVRADDRRAILGMIQYPLRVNESGGTRTYRGATSVQRDFDRIFTPQVKRAILGQQAGNLFVRDQGAMIGDGEVWFDQICATTTCSPPGPVRIKAINP